MRDSDFERLMEKVTFWMAMFIGAFFGFWAGLLIGLAQVGPA